VNEASVTDRNALLRELMAVFDELPEPLRRAINYAPEPLDPKALAALCRRHGAASAPRRRRIGVEKAADGNGRARRGAAAAIDFPPAPNDNADQCKPSQICVTVPTLRWRISPRQRRRRSAAIMGVS
jgi:hypothetical protein